MWACAEQGRSLFFSAGNVIWGCLGVGIALACWLTSRGGHQSIAHTAPLCFFKWWRVCRPALWLSWTFLRSKAVPSAQLRKELHFPKPGWTELGEERGAEAFPSSLQETSTHVSWWQGPAKVIHSLMYQGKLKNPEMLFYCNPSRKRALLSSWGGMPLFNQGAQRNAHPELPFSSGLWHEHCVLTFKHSLYFLNQHSHVWGGGRLGFHLWTLLTSRPGEVLASKMTSSWLTYAMGQIRSPSPWENSHTLSKEVNLLVRNTANAGDSLAHILSFRKLQVWL